MSPFSSYSVSMLKDAITSIHAAALQEGGLKNFEGARILYDWCHTLHSLTENGTEVGTPVSQPTSTRS